MNSAKEGIIDSAHQVKEKQSSAGTDLKYEKLDFRKKMTAILTETELTITIIRLINPQTIELCNLN